VKEADEFEFAKSSAASVVGGVGCETGRSAGVGGGTESRGRCRTESDDDDVSSAKLGRVRGKWLESGCGCLRGCQSLPIMAFGRLKFESGGQAAVMMGVEEEEQGRTRSRVSREEWKGSSISSNSCAAPLRKKRLEAPVEGLGTRACHWFAQAAGEGAAAL
jgi:hypothetical protein